MEQDKRVEEPEELDSYAEKKDYWDKYVEV